MNSNDLMILGRPVRRPQLIQLILLFALAVAGIWSYWPILVDMVKTWYHQEEYSHGFLVPVFAGVLLWFRRDQFAKVSLTPSWWGLALIVLAAGLRLSSLGLNREWFNQLALIPFVAGLTLLAGGWPALRWSWPAIAFLIFMVPLPFTVQTWFSAPLRRIATIATTYTMQTIGLPALSEGNVIIINDARLGVEEACSGLSMLVTFFALSTAVAILIDRPLVDRIVILLSAIPIAVAANVIRITTTGVLSALVGQEFANRMFHGPLGLAMMPLALLMMWLELKLISWLLVEPPMSAPVARPRPA